MGEFVSAVIVAAGSSSRMGQDKILMNICGKPAILYTLMAFEQSKVIDEIIVVGTEANKDRILKMIENNGISKFKGFALGGNSRQESTFNGINLCDSKADYFAIHDGARILVTEEEIEFVVKTAIEKKAAILGVPVKDTIKVVDEEGKVTYTPNRSSLWSIQTPQVFEKNLYLYALDRAREANMDYTDDSQLIENIHENVYIAKGIYSNVKLTTLDDIKICEKVILGRIE